ncbi:MAG TPA: LptA/OstA family protein [Allosphingosinicella sp.]
MARSKALLSVATGLVAGLFVLGGAPAAGQPQGVGAGLRNHDTNAPVDIAADRIEVQDRSNRAIVSGNVDVRQARLRLQAQRVTVAYSGAGNNQIERIDATGGVTLTSPSETIRGNTAIYDLDAKIITLLGGVSLRNPDGNLQGGRLVYDLRSGRAVMDGGVPGAPGSATSPTGRVTGRFTVPQRQNN